jgi:hypothetical protein
MKASRYVGLSAAVFVLLSACHGVARRATHHENSFASGTRLELRVFLSPTRHFSAFNDSGALVWHDTDFTYADDFTARSTTVQVPLTEQLLSNGSLFAHVFVSKQGASPDPKHGSYERWSSTGTTAELVVYDKPLEPIGLYNLLTGEPAPWETELRRGAEEAKARGRDGQFISYWKPSMHAQLLIDTDTHPIGGMPPLLQNYLHAYRLMSGHRFRPLIYVNELTVMKQHWMAINNTAKSLSPSLPLELSFSPLPSRRFQWMVNLQHSFKMNEETLGISEKESEDLRGMFVHTNPVLLYTTVAVSAVHLLFDMLAFKNDISFWNSVDSMEGLSSRTLILNQAMEAVILLYLFEEDASWLVKVTSVSVSLGVSAWVWHLGPQLKSTIS